MEQTGTKEYRIADNIVKILEGNIVHIIASGDQDGETAADHYLLHKELRKTIHGKINYLIDLNRTGKSSPQARQVWKKLSESEFTEKIALWGIHPVARILATFVMGVTHKTDMRFFTSMEEAAEWLGIPPESVK